MALVSIALEEKYYKKDPQSSELGRAIIEGAIELIDELGFEQFTFKKLAHHIDSTEASIYRYFENKLMLLVYLSAWYWTCMEYSIGIMIHPLKSPEEKLEKALELLCIEEQAVKTFKTMGIEVSKLRKIVFHESDKTYMTKKVDEINSMGLFKEYKLLCNRISTIIQEINPAYPYAHSLVSTIMEAAHQQIFFAKHLPSLTDLRLDDQEPTDQQALIYIRDLVNKVILKP